MLFKSFSVERALWPGGAAARLPAKRANIKFAVRQTYRHKDRARMVTFFYPSFVTGVLPGGAAAHIEFPVRETVRLKEGARTATLLYAICDGRSRPAALPPGLSFKSDRFCRRQNRAWSVKNCFRKTADMRRRFARSWLCGEQSHGWKEVNQKASPFERGKTLQSFVK